MQMAQKGAKLHTFYHDTDVVGREYVVKRATPKFGVHVRTGKRGGESKGQ